ncbi:MAG: (R)-2-hydroxyacyl-CoA dehydratese activating ATPase [Clostridia bacterium]|nr:(R)-2-hydroxyacyl-CoA dehydratese activating ATPase [Clostridia bacterium]
MYAGLDLGSRSVKLALLAGDEIKELRQYDTIKFYRQYGSLVEGKLLLDFEALNLPPLQGLVATGYGRLAARIAGAEVIPEIKAHVLGAVWQTGLEDFTLLDLGGQDSKIIMVRRGRLVNFLTNDRCAASSGRYLENMAAVLGMTVEELGQYADDPVELSSTCAVFGETELVGRIVEGHSLASLAAGVNYTIFHRVRPLLEKYKSPVIVFAGGVAKNQALRRILKRELKVEVVVPAYPQYNGALGCCLQAKQVRSIVKQKGDRVYDQK